MRNRKTNSVRIEFTHDNRVDVIESLRPGSSETTVNFSPGSFLPYVIPSKRYFAPYFGRQPMQYDRSNFLLMSGDNFAQQRGPNLNLFEMRLFAIDRDETTRIQFNSIISRIIPQGVSWTIDQTESSQYVLRFLGTDKAHSAEGVGEGIASLFTLVASLFDSSDGDIIVIDEPELSLHPTLQKRLGRVIADFASTRQIIVATHSPYMVDEVAINNGAQLCRTWERASGSEIARLGARGRDAWRRLTGTNLNNPHQFGLNAKEVFFLDDGVIVVEGQEDVILLPKVFDELGVNLPAEFFGWGAGGAENIKHVCSILEDLGFLRVAAIFDNDKQKATEDTRAAFPLYYVSQLPADDVRSKAASNRPAKRGLLTSSYAIDPDYESATRAMVKEVSEFLSAGGGGAATHGTAAAG
jgi:predicted ATP-dependent endonuclease of OLD family